MVGVGRVQCQCDADADAGRAHATKRPIDAADGSLWRHGGCFTSAPSDNNSMYISSCAFVHRADFALFDNCSIV